MAIRPFQKKTEKREMDDFVCSRICYITFKPDVVVTYEVVHDQKNIYILKNVTTWKKFVSNCANLASQFQSEKIACVFSTYRFI